MKLISMKQLAEILGVSRRTAEVYVNDPSFPSCYKLPNGRGGMSHPRWSIDDIIQWMASFKK
jgi:predicted DNA-binding transcriptional regulator AlpA